MIEVLPGTRFGRLTVVKELASVPKHKRKRRRFELHCDCGSAHEAWIHCLRNGDTKSCGCLQKEQAATRCRKVRPLAKGVAACNSLLNGYRQGAKRRGHIFELTIDEFKLLTQSNCFYCGAAPNQIRKDSQLNGTYVYNGIDRLNNREGYSAGNCVSCCETCNKAKAAMPVDEFKAWVLKVYLHLNRE